MQQPRPRRAHLVWLLAAVALTACTPRATEPTTAPTTTEDPYTTAATAAPLTSCGHPLPADATGIGVRGRASSGSLVALLFGPEIRAGEQTKIAWRVTGTGDVRFSATGPGPEQSPVWGPEEHGGSTFRYPGDEWGTGFVFPAPGCWTVHVTRDDMTGELPLPVG